MATWRATHIQINLLNPLQDSQDVLLRSGSSADCRLIDDENLDDKSFMPTLGEQDLPKKEMPAIITSMKF